MRLVARILAAPAPKTPTKTIALRRHRPGVGHGAKASAEKRDQRGHKRDKHPDIDAFER